VAADLGQSAEALASLRAHASTVFVSPNLPAHEGEETALGDQNADADLSDSGTRAVWKCAGPPDTGHHGSTTVVATAT
jgi:hypothetical protein